jgi:hypothetical protein
MLQAGVSPPLSLVTSRKNDLLKIDQLASTRRA